MKSTQSILLLCVVVGMVFGVTFAVNYLGGRGASTKKDHRPPSQAELTFAENVTSFPQDPTMPAECELGHSQAHDFWFKNENAQDLPVGVFSKTCQCTSVQMWVAKDLKDVPEATEREKAMKELEAAGAPTELKEKEAGVVVPAGAVGVVRLTWSGNRPGGKDLAAQLWQGEKGGPEKHFQIRTTFVGPLRAESAEVDLGEQPLEQLPYKRSFKCWSATRREFPLYASVLQYRLNEESNPFVVGEPVPLTEAELDELRKNRANGTVLAGYSVPVTLLRESKDKMPFDVGIFRQRVELKTEDDPDPIQVIVKGTVLGDLAVVVPESGPVDFRNFDRTAEVKREVLVESGVDVTRLELDEQRTADFLGVDFPAAPEKNGGRKTWRLTVKWLTDKQAGGKFPRDVDEYRDSAVYVKPVVARKEGAPSSLRIPVTGTADDAPKGDGAPP